MSALGMLKNAASGVLVPVPRHLLVRAPHPSKLVRPFCAKNFQHLLFFLGGSRTLLGSCQVGIFENFFRPT